VLELLTWANGQWWQRGRIPVFITKLAQDLHCNPNELTDEVVHENLTRVFLCTIFSALPPEPMVSRWGKVYTTATWFNVAQGVHSLLEWCFGLAFDGAFGDSILCAGAMAVADGAGDALVPPEPVPPAPLPLAPGPMASEMVDLNIFETAPVDIVDQSFDSNSAEQRAKRNEELRGRMRKCAGGLRCEQNAWLTSAIVSMTAAPNYLYAWMLKRMHERFVDPEHLRTSLLTDLKHAPVSPITIVRQYHAAMLLQPYNRSPLLHIRGLNRERVDLLHRAILTADGGIYTRFEYLLEETWPWIMVGLADQRRSDHSQIRADLATMRRCCPDASFTATLLRMAEDLCGISSDNTRSVAYIRGPFVYSLAMVLARCIDGVCDDLELRHARNRTDSCGNSMTPLGLSTANTLREWMTVYDSYVAASRDDDTCGGGDGADSTTTAPGARKCSGKLAFHLARARNTGKNSFTKSEWLVTHAQWDLMADDERRSYGELADLLNDGGSARATMPHCESDDRPHVPIASAIADAFSCSEFATLALPLKDGRELPLTLRDINSCTQKDAITSWAARLGGTHKRPNMAIEDSIPVGVITDAALDEHDQTERTQADSACPRPSRASPLTAADTKPDRCQDIGICKAEVSTSIYRRFKHMQTSINAFLREAGRGHMTTDAIGLLLLLFEGVNVNVDGDAEEIVDHRVFWVGFANGSPLFQTWTSMESIGLDPSGPFAMPCELQPTTQPHIVPASIVLELQSSNGRLTTNRSMRLIRRMACRDDISIWRLSRLAYDPVVLEDTCASLGRLRATSRMAHPAPLRVDIGRPRVKPPAAPKPKPAPPPPPMPAPPTGLGRGRGRGRGRGCGRVGGRGRGACGAAAPVCGANAPDIAVCDGHADHAIQDAAADQDGDSDSSDSSNAEPQLSHAHSAIDDFSNGALHRELEQLANAGLKNMSHLDDIATMCDDSAAAGDAPTLTRQPLRPNQTCVWYDDESPAGLAMPLVAQSCAMCLE